MSGTKSALRTAPAIDRRRLWRLRLILWPFATTAVAINLFLMGLIGLSVGLPAISPMAALIWALPLGLPATWAAARWIGGLIAEAENG